MKVRGSGSSTGHLVGLLTLPVAAIDFSASGFGTVGYARSDQSYSYQRFIDDSGTFWRDTVAGLQVDARFADKFGATVQFKLAPASNNDNEYKGTVSWAFLSWRPTNDWLFRAGKQRIPLYLYSQTVDVGVTYDFARLPTEMYSIISSNDFTGLSLSKTWGVWIVANFPLDGYWGKSRRISASGFATTFRRCRVRAQHLRRRKSRAAGWCCRTSAMRTPIAPASTGPSSSYGTALPFPTTFPFVPLAPGIGYYQVDPSLPGPGVPVADSLTANVVTLGAEVDLGYGFRVISELARTFVPDTDISAASTRGYVVAAQAYREIGRHTSSTRFCARAQPSASCTTTSTTTRYLISFLAPS